MMPPSDEFDYDEWGGRLDAGQRSDSLLDLAAGLQAVAAATEGPDPAFEARLRARLVAQYDRPRPLARSTARRWAIAGLVLLAAVALVVVVGQFWPGSVPAVSAAEVLQQANRRLAKQWATGDVVYDQLRLDWDQGGDWRRKGVVADLWRAADGTALRYQMYDGRDLLYFEQHDGQHLWRSSQVRPVEGRPVTFVYQAPYRPAAGDLLGRQLAGRLLFRDLSTFWLYIDRLAVAGDGICGDLLCVMSGLGGDWDCAGDSCTLNLGPLFGDQDFIVSAQVTGQERLAGGRDVYVVRLAGPGPADKFYTNLKFDVATFDLLEIEDYWDGRFHYRLGLLARQGLACGDLPPGFFQSVPDGIEVRPWAGDIALGHKEDDQVWIVSTDPPQGASLSGVVTAALEIGYRLTSVEEAAIEVGLAWVGHDSPLAIPGARLPVTAGEGTLPLTFTLDTDQLGPGTWAVTAVFMDTLGVSPNSGWSAGGLSSGIYVEWCVGCPVESPTPIPNN